jgi:UDP-N-acetylmuramate--alanine ligase
MKIHFVGISGAGLSALAQVMLGRGAQVSGSDPTAPNPTTERLEKLGAQVFSNHSAEHIEGADMIVATSAASGDNPEIIAAHLQQIPVLRRREFLREVTRGNDVVAIAGSHGKTTTTAMIALVLQAGGLDPTVVVGGNVPDWNTNARVGRSNWFVIEADEYDYAFLGLEPKIAVVTNVDYDHPDLFSTPDAYRSAFERFLKQTRTDGVSIVCGDDPTVIKLAKSVTNDTVTFGVANTNEWYATDLRPNGRGGSDFSVHHSQELITNVSLAIPGQHNVLNALAAFAAAYVAGVAVERIKETLGRFAGVGRRFQVRGAYNGATVVDDYAHHPTEIRVNLEAARKRFPNARIVALFQPHTFSRTRVLMDEFAKAFEAADVVLITEIYAAREHDDSGMSSRALVERMHHSNVRYVETLDEALEILRKELCSGDVLITLGAGNVNRVAQDLTG